jgi:single-strand DNA-binding protein
MASFNRVILVGNLTRDPEVRYTTSSMAVCDIGLAVNDRRKSANGEWIEETTFVDVTLWGRTAEVAGEYLKKGAPVLIEGRLKLDSWEKDGQKRSKLKVVGETMQMLGSREGGGGGGGGSRGRSSAPPAQDDDYSQDDRYSAPRSAPAGGRPPQNQDDIPF